MHAYVSLWMFMGIYGCHGYLWVSWVSMGAYGSLWMLMGIYECLWVSWVCMDIYWFLGVDGHYI